MAFAQLGSDSPGIVTEQENDMGIGDRVVNTAYPPGNVLRYGAVADREVSQGGDTGTDSTQAFQDAIDAVFAPSNDNAGSVIIPPGRYSIRSTLTFRDCNIVSELGVSPNNGVRLYWDGASGGTMFSKPTGTFGSASFGLVQGFELLGGANEPDTFIHLTSTSGNLDVLFQLNRLHFGSCLSDAIICDNAFVNCHWTHLRFDAIGGYAIRLNMSASSNLQSFSLDQFTYDHQRSDNLGEGVIYLDNLDDSAGPGIVSLSNGRIEINETRTGAKSIFTHRAADGGSANARSTMYVLRNVTYQDSAPETANCVLYRETTNTTGGETLILDNVMMDTIDEVIGGTWPSNTWFPPAQHYAHLTHQAGGVIANDSREDQVVVWGTGNYCNRVKIRQDTEDRFRIRGDGRAEWGSGSAAADTNLYRGAANELKTDDFLGAVAGLGTDTYSANTNTPSGATAQAMEVFDADGNSIGFVPVYGSAW